MIFRTSAMGDVAMLPHAVRALRAAYPDLRITVATRALFRPFFEGLGVEILEIDTRGAHRSVGGLLRLAGEIRRMGVDAFADVHGVLRSKVLRTALWLAGVRTACIRKGRVAKWMRLGCGSRPCEPLKHTVVRYCDVFRRLGFVLDDPALAVRRPASAVHCPVPGVPDEKRGVWIGFAPFSAQTGKTYPRELSREAMRLLSGRCERLFIHSGGGSEADFAAEMERELPNVTALFGRVKLGGEIDLIAQLDCVVSMDSLVMHLASLTATPVVSVWGATHPSLGFLGYGCDPAGVVQLDLECRPCSVYGARKCKFGDYRCIRGITPQMIAAAVDAMLEKHSKR